MDFNRASKVVLEECLGVKPNEKVLIVTDDLKEDIGRALYNAACDLGTEAMIMVMKPRKVSGEEPPASVAKAMEEADVVICPTESSLTHTQAKVNAVQKGTRVATMPGITEEMFTYGAITADYKEVEKLTLKMADLLSRGETARVVKSGYTLTMSLKGRSGVASTGILHESGMAGNLPSGEAYIAPVEGTAYGEMLIDGSMVGVGKLEEPLYVKIEDGKLVEIKGKDASKLSVLLENDRNANLGELGIGTNREARLCGMILEDEKVYGTAHIAFGTNISFGGNIKADCHLDGIILNPDIYIDDVLVATEGRIII